jgi:hypothetical protein
MRALGALLPGLTLMTGLPARADGLKDPLVGTWMLVSVHEMHGEARKEAWGLGVGGT